MKCKITFIIRELSLSYKESKLSSGAIESKTLSIVITPASFVDSRYRLLSLVFLGSSFYFSSNEASEFFIVTENILVYLLKYYLYTNILFWDVFYCNLRSLFDMFFQE
jgi:hypothetical protein